jgi:hypothetical protein
MGWANLWMGALAGETVEGFGDNKRSSFPAQLPGQGGGVEMSVSRQHRQRFMAGYPRNFKDIK